MVDKQKNVRSTKEKKLLFKQLLFIEEESYRKEKREKRKRLKVKKKLYAGIFFLAVLIVLAILVGKINRQKPDITLYTSEYVPVREALEELLFVPYTLEDWEAVLGNYEKKVLTQKEIPIILDYLGITDYIDWKRNGKIVTREEWASLYEDIRAYLDTEKIVQAESVMILETMEAEEGCILVTNKGDYTASFRSDYLTDWQTYRLYLAKEKCIGIAGISNETSRIYNAFQKEATEQTLTFLYRGAEYQIEAEGLKNSQNQVCDLEFQNGVLRKKYEKQDTIEGELLSYDEQKIEISGYGKVAHQGELPVYQIYGSVQEKALSDIILGNMKAKYVVAGEEICAILLEEPPDIKKIRVLLLNEDGKTGREAVRLLVSEESRVTNGTQQTTIPAGTILRIEEYGLKENGNTLSVESVSGTGTIAICDDAGTIQGNPYFGKMELRYREEGYTMVNELPIEEYLYAVVPSEMPSSYQMEALKAQAVCARSYAYIQLFRADYASYGAHVDDSTSYQVYNKTPKTEQSVLAVDETRGQVMTYQNNIMEAYYFSTSCGYTDTISVWNIQENGTYGYLKKVCLNQEESADLSKEDVFREYIQNPNTGYDSGVPFYRWSTTASFIGKEEELASVIKMRKGIATQNIIYYNKDGSQQKEEMDSFGTLKRILVTERSSSGSILNLRLEYENGLVDVKTEYNVRRILAVGTEKIMLADETERTMGVLPSAFCTLIPLEDGSYKIYGGGYGHGLGMSQNGANGLAQEGKNYQEILAFFYQNMTLSDASECNFPTD